MLIDYFPFRLDLCLEYLQALMMIVDASFFFKMPERLE